MPRLNSEAYRAIQNAPPGRGVDVRVAQTLVAYHLTEYTTIRILSCVVCD